MDVIYKSVNDGKGKQEKNKRPLLERLRKVGMKKKNDKEVPNCVPKSKRATTKEKS